MPFYSRRRPHYQPQDADFFATFRLAGSLPLSAAERLATQLDTMNAPLDRSQPDSRQNIRIVKFRREFLEAYEQILNPGSVGPTWLGIPEVADVIADALRYRDGKQYELYAYSIMPNHVHVVCHIGNSHPSSYPLTDVLQNLKWYTALKCNRILNRTGAFWQHESYDHVIRSSIKMHHTIFYTVNNPVKAGLVRHWRDWRWNYCKFDNVADQQSSGEQTARPTEFRPTTPPSRPP